MNRTEIFVFFLFIFAAAAAAGVIVSVKRAGQKKKSFQELLEDAIAVPLLTGGDCTAWFREKNGDFPGKNLGILSYATPLVVEALGVECPREVDLNQYLVQMLVREKTRECLAFRLINFEELAPKLRERMAEGRITVELEETSA